MVLNPGELDDDMEQRLTEHADRLRQVEERQNIHARRFDDLTLIVVGDEKIKVKGLIERTQNMEALLADLVQWRRDLMIWGRVALGLLAVGALGEWLPYMQVILRLIGG